VRTTFLEERFSGTYTKAQKDSSPLLYLDKSYLSREAKALVVYGIQILEESRQNVNHC
jgi:hypothetical protein